MLMVVFGAGASFDSSSDGPAPYSGNDSARPPLAERLFEPSEHQAGILKKYPQIAGILPDLRRSARKDATGNLTETVEQALQRLRSEAVEDDDLLCQLAAVKFYLRDLIEKIASNWAETFARHLTTYSWLLQKIHSCTLSDSTVLLVTFNYDTMIDDAVRTRPNHHIKGIDDYVTNPKFQLFKLHGSTNWGHKLELPEAEYKSICRRGADLIPEYIINSAATATWSTKYLITNGDLALGNALWSPALSIPLARKEGSQDCECPTEHWEVLYKHLPDVDRILTIGWSAGDTYFLDKVLKPRLPRGVRLLTVGQDQHDATKIAEEIQSHINVRPETGSPDGFTQFVASGAGEKFMSGD